MLHKSKSKRMNAYKFALVIPLLVAFVFNFNTELIAQTKNPESENVTIGQNVLKFIITKDTKDRQLESIKEKLAEQKTTVTFDNVQRNLQHELVGINISYEHHGKSGNYFINSENPIHEIAISLNVDTNKLSVGPATKNLSQSFDVVKKDGETTLKKEDNIENVVVYSTDNEESEDTVNVVGKDGNEHKIKTEKNVYVIKSNSTKNSKDDEENVFLKKNKKDTVWIKKDVKNIIWTDDDGNVTQINASENGKNTYNFVTNGDHKPFIIVDGEKVSSDDLSKIKPSTIASVNVFKGEEAVKKYGEKGKNGVLYITTKDDATVNEANHTIAIGDRTIGEKKDTDAKEDSNPWAIGLSISEEKNEGTNLSTSTTLIIKKQTSDEFLEKHKKYLKSKGVIFKYSKLKRNSDGDIVRIKIELSNGHGKSQSETFANDEGISQIGIGFKGDDLFINAGNY